MSPPRIITVLLLSVTTALCSAAPTLPGIGAAMDALIAQNEIAGAVLASNHSPLFAPVPEPTLKGAITSLSAAALDLLAKN